MNKDKDIAILIRRSPLTETSLIVHWCAPHCGFLKTVAKGARNPKNRFHGNLDLFFQAEIEIVRSRTSDLHVLRDLCVTETRLGIRSSYRRTLAGAYFIRLLETVCERETPIPDLFDLLRRALDYLARQEPTLRAVHHFEDGVARALGLETSAVPAIQSIAELVHQKVPEQREELLRILKKQQKPGPD